MRAKTFEDYRELFLDCGLMYGRHFGSKSGYRENNPGSIFIPNACVYLRNGTCAWRGDLDLAGDDRQRLLAASQKMNRRLFVLREQAGRDHLPAQLLAMEAMFVFWRGEVATIGSGVRWYGTFAHLLQRSRELAAAPRPRKRIPKGRSLAVVLKALFGPEERAATKAKSDDGHLPHIPNAKTRAAMREPTRRRFRSAKAQSVEQMGKWIGQDEEAAAALKLLQW